LPDGLPDGISSHEGTEAFLRILAGAELPQIVVSPEDLTALVERARTPASAAGEPADAAQAPLDGAARPAHARPDVSTPYVEPREGLEKALAAIWREILGIEQVGTDDHFLELGGDSVQAIQVILQAQRLGLRLTPQQLFESPTIASLARLAGESPATAAPAAEEDWHLPTGPYPAESGDFSPAAFPLAELDEQSLSILMSQLHDAE
jgi:acyl carrier protein